MPSPENSDVPLRPLLHTVWAVLSWRDATGRLHAEALPLIEAKLFLERLHALEPDTHDLRVEFFR